MDQKNHHLKVLPTVLEDHLGNVSFNSVPTQELRS